MVSKRPYFSFFSVLFAFFAGAAFPAAGADIRTDPIDAYVLIDVSASMGKAVSDATDWICDNIVDGTLIDGDRLTVWTFSADTVRLIDRMIIAKDTKEKTKAEIRRISGDGRAPNIAAALREMLDEAQKRRDPRSVSYLLVASSLVESGNEDADRLLKRSRVRELPGWKAVVVGVGVEEKVKEGAKSYFDAVGSP